MKAVGAVLLLVLATSSICLMGCGRKKQRFVCNVDKVEGRWVKLDSGKTAGSTREVEYGVSKAKGFEVTSEWSAGLMLEAVPGALGFELSQTFASTVTRSIETHKTETSVDEWKYDGYVLWQWQGSIYNKKSADGRCPKKMEYKLQHTAWTDRVDTKPVCLPGGCSADATGRCCACTDPRLRIKANPDCQPLNCLAGDSSQEVVIGHTVEITIQDDIAAGKTITKKCSSYNSEYDGDVYLVCKPETGQFAVEVQCRKKGSKPQVEACHTLDNSWASVTANCATEYGSAENLFDCNPQSVWFVGAGQAAEMVGGWAELTAEFGNGFEALPVAGVSFYAPPKGHLGQQSFELAFRQYQIDKKVSDSWVKVQSGQCESAPGESGWGVCDVKFGSVHRANLWRLRIKGNYGGKDIFKNGEMALAGIKFDTMEGPFSRGMTNITADDASYSGCLQAHAILTWVILACTWTFMK